MGHGPKKRNSQRKLRNFIMWDCKTTVKKCMGYGYSCAQRKIYGLNSFIRKE